MTHHYKGDTISALLCNIFKGPAMDNNLERRKYKRYDEGSIEDRFIARLQIKSDKVQEIKSDIYDPVTLVNISAGGIFFLSEKDLGLGSHFEVKIDIVHSSQTVDCAGEIVRIEKSTSSPVFAIAIEFKGLDEQEKEMIITTIEGFLE
ncbi:MAG: PilZ domain-containing protein [Candidatus Scalindua sp.]|nr:PilZ domain-containing protein [Candidatus Scalindua sp.]